MNAYLWHYMDKFQYNYPPYLYVYLPIDSLDILLNYILKDLFQMYLIGSASANFFIYFKYTWAELLKVK